MSCANQGNSMHTVRQVVLIVYLSKLSDSCVEDGKTMEESYATISKDADNSETGKSAIEVF